MKNIFGNSITVTLFGESHGEQIGAVIDGMAPGIEVDIEFIRKQLELRKPHGRISTQRVETDEPHIVSGVFEGKTTGTPICILFENNNTKSKDYSKTKDLMRPGHADYTALQKYHGYADYRGGGHFSGRITAPLVAAGALAIKMLEKNYRRRRKLRNSYSFSPLKFVSVAFLSSTRQGQAAFSGDCFLRLRKS